MSLRGLSVVALALTLAACSKGEPVAVDAGPLPPARIVVTHLEVLDTTPPQLRPATIPQAKLQSMVQQTLTDAGLLLNTPPSPSTWRATISARATYGLTTGDGLLGTVAPGDARVVWGVEVELKAPGRSEASHAWFQGEASAPFAGTKAAALQVALTAQARAALAPVTAGLTARREVMSLRTPALIERLTAKHAATRLAVVDRLAELRAKEAVPALATLAGAEPDRSIKLRVVGALAEIGDARAATTLIDLADPKDRVMLRAVVEALSVVGGERVDDFLDLLASHDAPDVREMIEQARARRVRAAKQAERVKGSQP